MPENMIIFGEIGLSGEIRPVGQSNARIREAAKLGFTAALTPAITTSGNKRKDQQLQVTEIQHLSGLVNQFDEEVFKTQG